MVPYSVGRKPEKFSNEIIEIDIENELENKILAKKK